MILNPQQSFSSQVTLPNQVYVIIGDMDLELATVTMPNNCVLHFDGGRLINGEIIGVNTRIHNPFDRIVFDDIVLSSIVSYSPSTPVTGWLGECKDIWFNYSELTGSHFNIVKSVCQFEVCTFTNRRYFIEDWETIHLRSLGCVIHGGNATFIITNDKGTIGSGWNNLPEYQTSCLFYKSSYCFEFAPNEEAGVLEVSNLSIQDNGQVRAEAASARDVPSFVFYAIFKGSANHIVFRDVDYDGPGGLWASYNTNVAIHSIEIIGCNIRTGQFAFELGNVGISSTLSNSTRSNVNEGGSCGKFYIKNTKIYNYADNVLVGPLSIVVHNPFYSYNVTKELIIEGAFFESEKVKNLEVFGCQNVCIRNSIFMSVFCSSAKERYSDGSPVNQVFYVFDNFFGISENISQSTNEALQICAGDTFFIHNTVICDFSHPYSSGGFRLSGYGKNLAVVSGNHFIIKGTNNNSFKSLLSYEDLTLDLIDNTYSFLEGVLQGYGVSVGGAGSFIHLETEDDPRFDNTAGGGFFDWKDIPIGQRTPEGFIVKNSVLSLDNSYPYDPNFVSIPSFEIDLRVRADGLSKNGWLNLLSFHAGTVSNNGIDYERFVYLKTYFGTFRAIVSLDDGITQQEIEFSSGMSLNVALPSLGFDTYGENMGYFRIVFINELVSNAILTRIVLFINDFQIDTFFLDQDILNLGISSIKLYGSPYLRIKNYRLRTHVKSISNPAVHDRLAFKPNSGYAKSGPTANRPISPDIGFLYYDTQINKPVVYTGSQWIALI